MISALMMRHATTQPHHLGASRRAEPAVREVTWEARFELYAWRRIAAERSRYRGLVFPPPRAREYPAAEALETRDFARRYPSFCDPRDALPCKGEAPAGPPLPEWLAPWEPELSRMGAHAVGLARRTRPGESAPGAEAPGGCLLERAALTARPSCGHDHRGLLRLPLSPLGIDKHLELAWCQACGPTEEAGARVTSSELGAPLPGARVMHELEAVSVCSFPDLRASEPPPGTAARELETQVAFFAGGEAVRFYDLFARAVRPGPGTFGQLGGYARFRQEDETPICAGCSEPMLLLASCGLDEAAKRMAYFFACNRYAGCEGLANVRFFTQTSA